MSEVLDLYSLNLVNQDGSLRTISAIEELVIQHAVVHCKGNMSQVARELGIGRSSLYRKIGRIVCEGR